MAKQFSYGKEEKLKSRKLTEQLFSKGKTFTVFPLKVFYMPVKEELDFPVKAGVGTGSRNFKKAADRNRVKRLLREAYRTEKNALTDYARANQKHVAIFFLYIDKVLPEYTLIKSKMPLAIGKLIKQLHEVAVANT
ncbi:ribonuclease P protein component [Panacibacter ginsenosidivorans]|uniref:Ribonuclease P protein component n=1 Tax=Panacibacter ginsenosidivorans TaxID=1813871 RepID=A0A5B8V8I4_9BACT|nr:ribonuclease P protein component [Panacibacter ginsenosidivorans]QEC67850.1 ribonuclease P protein component [Panacibacter ginsenosidivorans]